MNVLEMKEKRVIAVIGCPPLPGSPMYRPMTRERYCAYVVNELDTLIAGGIESVMLQNIGDLPVPEEARAETIAWMSMLGSLIRDRTPGFLGVSLLEDDAEATLSVAQAIGADFVRLKVFVGAMTGPDGVRQGNAYKAQRYRTQLGARDIAIFSDVYDRTRWPLEGQHFEAMVHEAVWYGKSDGLVITGRTHHETFRLLERARAVTDVPILVGGGVDASNVKDYLKKSNGVIVGTSLKQQDELLEPIDKGRVVALAKAVCYGEITTS